MFVTVSDPADPAFAPFRRLNDAAFRRQVEAASPFGPGTFVIEGWLALEAALATGQALRSILVAEPRAERLAVLLGGREVVVVVTEPAVITEVVGFDLHRGVVAVAERRRLPEPTALAARSRRLLVVESVNDGENLGALFRTAAALGADGALLDPTCHDPWSRRSVRVSLGQVLRVPWARAPEPWRLPGHLVVALTPAPDAQDLRDVAVPADRPVAVVVGAEGPGLSPAALAAADVRARIPMAHGIDSLNVATAAGIAMWHLYSTGSVGRGVTDP